MLKTIRSGLQKVSRKATELTIQAKSFVESKKAEGYVDTGVKILIAVVIGALLLGGLYLLFDNEILPTVDEKIYWLFRYPRHPVHSG